jgi:hypothetical protein
MNIKTALLGFTIAGVTALTASCSGSTDSNENGGGTSGSSAGKGSSGSSAGTTSKGGASGTGGASSAGTTSKGGTNGNAGRNTGGGANIGGTFNFGGAGLDPADFMCDPVPTKGADCAAGTQPCTDGTAVCYCQASKWACLDLADAAGGAGPGGGFGQLDCPATKPMSGDACGDSLGFCPYGQNAGCACYNGAWACN